MDTKLRNYIEAAGFQSDELSDENVKFFEAQMAQATPRPGTLPDDPFAKVKDEKERRTKLAEIAAAHADVANVAEVEKLLDLAIEAGTAPKDFELDLYRSRLPSGNFNQVRSKKTRVGDEVIEASLALAGGIGEPGM